MKSELADDDSVIDRLHWYAANYQIMMERATRWDLQRSRLEKRVRELGERNEQLVAQLAVLQIEADRAWAAMRKHGIKPDDGEA